MASRVDLPAIPICLGVNPTLLLSLNSTPYNEYRKAIIESGVKIVETAGRSPEEHLPDYSTEAFPFDCCAR